MEGIIYVGGASMLREKDGRWARGVPPQSIAGFEKIGFRVVSRREEEQMQEADAPAPAPAKPFDFASLDRDALKLLYGRAMSEGVALPHPPGAAGVKWFSEKLAASGWKPKEPTDG